MTIPDPPWKQKTRPCPFYSQGRCLFSDSCNFLHDVKIRVKQPNITITDSTPDVIISSPQASSVVASPTTRNVSVRSPPRSPRLSSLLLALGDAIQTDEEDGSVDSPPPLTLPSNAIVPYSRTPNGDIHSEELKNEDSGLPAPPDNDESKVENEVIHELAQTPSAMEVLEASRVTCSRPLK
ncbi:hypothetical protein BC629DRAFT_690378 [Irpex lacteus]|nr:hypothetical protein BC629DRAFT_690378 [Irpex lacteus]